MTIKNNKIKYIERMLSLAEEDKRKQDKIIRRMTYNEEVLKKACSDTEKKNINLESTVNYLKPTCTEKNLKISTMECEINSKVEDIRRLNQQTQVLSNDLKEFRDKTTALQKQIRELQYHIKEYDK
jgi:chromosome segregation ATPase